MVYSTYLWWFGWFIVVLTTFFHIIQVIKPCLGTRMPWWIGGVPLLKQPPNVDGTRSFMGNIPMFLDIFLIQEYIYLSIHPSWRIGGAISIKAILLLKTAQFLEEQCPLYPTSTLLTQEWNQTDSKESEIFCPLSALSGSTTLSMCRSLNATASGAAVPPSATTSALVSAPALENKPCGKPRRQQSFASDNGVDPKKKRQMITKHGIWENHIHPWKLHCPSFLAALAMAWNSIGMHSLVWWSCSDEELVWARCMQRIICDTLQTKIFIWILVCGKIWRYGTARPTFFIQQALWNMLEYIE